MSLDEHVNFYEKPGNIRYLIARKIPQGNLGHGSTNSRSNRIRIGILKSLPLLGKWGEDQVPDPRI